MNCIIIVLEQHRKSWETTKGIHLYDNDYNALHEQSLIYLCTTKMTMIIMTETTMEWTTVLSSVATTESNRVNARVLHEMLYLSSWFNPIANEVIDRAEAAEEETSDESDNVTYQSGREVAKANIELSPSHFAFYAKAGVIDPNLDLNNAYKQISIKPTTFCMAYDHSDPNQQAKWREAILRSFEICNPMEFGKRSGMQQCLRTRDA